MGQMRRRWLIRKPRYRRTPASSVPYDLGEAPGISTDRIFSVTLAGSALTHDSSDDGTAALMTKILLLECLD